MTEKKEKGRPSRFPKGTEMKQIRILVPADDYPMINKLIYAGLDVLEKHYKNKTIKDAKEV